MNMSCYSSIYKAKNKYIKNYCKTKELSYLIYWNVNNLYGWEMFQKLLLGNFKLVEEISEFNENFVKTYNGERVE